MTAPDHRDLPLRDYDHLPLSSLAQRIRSLTADQIGQLLGYEREHADRPAAVQIFTSRLDELAAGQSPTGGSPVGPQTAGAPGSAPPHGNPAQPAQPKGDRYNRGI